MNSALYCGHVVHKRVRPLRHAFAYRVFMMLLDLREMAQLDRGGWLFGHNRKALLSFYDRDHGPRNGAPLAPWVGEMLAQAGIAMKGLRIRIFCMPRLFGYVFNPLSIIFCRDDSDILRAIIYEVKNTFGDQHAYIFAVKNPDAPLLLDQCAKAFYVSPFMAMSGDYHFRLAPPGARFNLLIRQTIPEGAQLLASWTGQRQDWTPAALRRCLWRYPLVTFKVIGAIHWEALKLWLKKAPYFSPSGRFPARQEGRK